MSEMLKGRSGEAEAMLAAIDRSMAVIEFDLDGTILAANPNFLATMGYEASEILGKHHRIFVDPREAADPAYKLFWEKFRQGAFHSGTFRRFGKGGREVWIEASYTPVVRGGRPVKVVKFAADITDRHKAAVEAEGKMAALSRSQAIIEFTPDGHILTANQNFLDVMGYALAEIQGRHHRMFCSPEDADSPSYSAFWRALAQGQFASDEFRRIGKGGKEVHIRATYNPIVDVDGKVLKVVKFASDVTGQVSVQLLAEGLRQLADGNLAHRIETPFQPALENLRADFNATATRLDEAIRVVATNAGAIANTSAEIRAASEDLSRRTEQQAASVEETSAAVTQVSAAVKETAQAARSAGAAAGQARTSVDLVQDVLGRAKTAMQTIEGSTREIERIVTLIDKIAMQTNLLALNAGIEAARAGDVGRGFSVVAHEVRELSKRTKEAAGEVKGLIERSIADVSTGSGLVDAAGSSFDAVAGKVRDISGEVERIAASAVEQSGALEEIGQAVSSLDHGTQMNAAMVEQATAAAKGLADQAGDLFGLIGNFSVSRSPREGGSPD